MFVPPHEPDLALATVDVRAGSGPDAAAAAESWLRESAGDLMSGASVVRRSAYRSRLVAPFTWRTGVRPEDSWDDGGGAAADGVRVR